MLFAKPELFEAMSDLNGLQDVVQTAIALEHATIPPYLTALYSLTPSANTDIRDRLRDVVVEEMLHMTLACNLLNAIGGKPDLTKPGFLPDYPSPLPGTIEEGLIVPIKSFSMD